MGNEVEVGLNLQLYKYVYWVPQKLPQTCIVIAYICNGKVAWFAVYICGKIWNAQYICTLWTVCPCFASKEKKLIHKVEILHQNNHGPEIWILHFTIDILKYRCIFLFLIRVLVRGRSIVLNKRKQKNKSSFSGFPYLERGCVHSILLWREADKIIFYWLPIK